MDKKFFVVAYDIPDDRRRNRLHRALQGFGLPRQLSLFECILDDHEEERMLKRIKKIIVDDEDKVTLYPLCSQCVKGAQVLGRQEGLATEPDVIVI